MRTQTYVTVGGSLGGCALTYLPPHALLCDLEETFAVLRRQSGEAPVVHCGHRAHEREARTGQRPHPLRQPRHAAQRAATLPPGAFLSATRGDRQRGHGLERRQGARAEHCSKAGGERRRRRGRAAHGARR